jgi:hypothetical protein
MLRTNHGKKVGATNLDAVGKMGQRMLAKEALTQAELGKLLAKKWPRKTANDLAMVVRARVPLVQVPPRGMWGESGVSRHAPLRTIVGGPPKKKLTDPEMVLRYLSAFGPATVNDMQNWSGMTRLAPAFEALGDDLVRFKHGKVTMFDVPKAPRPEADAPAPPRFLPQFDNVFLGHKDRSRIHSAALLRQRFPQNAWIRFFLLDGFIAGTWKIHEEKGGTMSLRVAPFEPVSAADREALQAEGVGLLQMYAPDADRVTVG